MNPEIEFWKKAYDKKIQFSSKLSSSGNPKWVLTGGSSCAFQVDVSVLSNEFDIPAVNMAMHAGMGFHALLGVAVVECRSGDTLVVMLEPGLFFEDNNIPQLGRQALSLIFKKNVSVWIRQYYDLPYSSFISSFRPGLYHCVTMSAKRFQGGPIYRYSTENILEGGFMYTELKWDLVSGFAPSFSTVPEDKIEFFKNLVQYLNGISVNVVYILPWMYSQHEYAESHRDFNRNFCSVIETLIPVYEDGSLGVCENRDYYADTSLHMTRDGAATRTRVLGEILSSAH